MSYRIVPKEFIFQRVHDPFKPAFWFSIQCPQRNQPNKVFLSSRLSTNFRTSLVIGFRCLFCLIMGPIYCYWNSLQESREQLGKWNSLMQPLQQSPNELFCLTPKFHNHKQYIQQPLQLCQDALTKKLTITILPCNCKATAKANQRSYTNNLTG